MSNSGDKPDQVDRSDVGRFVVDDRSYRPGSAEDFERLYKATYSRILYALLGMVRDLPTAEDCAQEAFERAYKSWSAWRPEAPAEVWLHRIAVNVAMSHHRSSRVRQVGELLRRLGEPAVWEAPVDVELHSDLQEALRQLPPQQAAAMVLRHYYGYSTREIARAMGVQERTIAGRLALAKERLRNELRYDSPAYRTPAGKSAHGHA